MSHPPTLPCVGAAEEPVASPFSLRCLVHALAHGLGAEAKRKGLHLAYWVDPAVPAHLVGDERWLRERLEHLAGNALRLARGDVCLTVKPASTTSVATRMGLLFTVNETGQGLRPDEVVLLFQSFSRRGMGAEGERPAPLHAPSARTVSEFVVQTEPGTGSDVFLTVEFAVEDAPPRRHEPFAGTSSPSRRHGLRVLLAEDATVHQLLARALLERRGHTVLLAESAGHVLETLAREPVDVLLLEGIAPGHLEIAQTIREGTAAGVPADLPILVFASHLREEDRRRFVAVGIEDHLPEPFDLDELERGLVRARRRR